MLDILGEPLAMALVGGMGGVLLGLAARIGRFCTLGAIEDALYQGSDARLRMWILAVGLAIVATFTLSGLGLVAVERSIYALAPFSPVAAILGGLAFGYGMALAGNCGFGALARLGGGDLRAFVIVVVMGISAYVSLSGPLAHLRVWLISATALPPGTETGIATMAADVTGLAPAVTGSLAGLAIVAAALASAGFRARRRHHFWAAVVALAIVSGWVGTTWIATTGFAEMPVRSHTYAAPLGETILFAMTASGGGISFGVGSVMGVVVGAFLGSLAKGHFRWEACEDPRELRRQILGAALMGVGAVLAFGCSIGQGLSAMSVLTVSAPLTLAAIGLGAALGLRQLIFGLGLSTR